MRTESIKDLKAIVTGEIEETFDLIKDGEYVGFNRLEELVGNDYDNLNDDLMDGNHATYIKYENAEAVFYIAFKVGFEDFQKKALEGSGVQNDDKQVWVNVEEKQYTIDIEDVLDHEEKEPFEASFYLENNLDDAAWQNLYDQYLAEK